MQLIPKPELLDPRRPLHDLGPRFTADDRPEQGLLVHALEESCAYADELWNELNDVRQYLLDSLPPAAPADGPEEDEGSISLPTAPTDDPGWQRWIATFAATSSVLCGPHGDSGFGLDRAHEEARRRRVSATPSSPDTSPCGDSPNTHPAAADRSDEDVPTAHPRNTHA